MQKLTGLLYPMPTPANTAGIFLVDSLNNLPLRELCHSPYLYNI